MMLPVRRRRTPRWECVAAPAGCTADLHSAAGGSSANTDSMSDWESDWSPDSNTHTMNTQINKSDWSTACKISKILSLCTEATLFVVEELWKCDFVKCCIPPVSQRNFINVLGTHAYIGGLAVWQKGDSSKRIRQAGVVSSNQTTSLIHVAPQLELMLPWRHRHITTHNM